MKEKCKLCGRDWHVGITCKEQAKIEALSCTTESEGSVCVWSKYPEDNSYETTCNKSAWFEDQLRNGVWNFCPHCGLPITIDNCEEQPNDSGQPERGTKR